MSPARVDGRGLGMRQAYQRLLLPDTHVYLTIPYIVMIDYVVVYHTGMLYFISFYIS